MALVAGAGAGLRPAEAAGPVPARAIVTGSLLNVRSGPGTEFDLIDRLPEGTVVHLRTKQGGWFEVQAPSGTVGWVAADYITADLTGVRIVVDPGHGGTDGGAYANTLVEREVNLAIALPLRDILVARGAEVRMTREDRNPNLPLWNSNPYDPSTRTGMANAWPADMLISVHNNASANTSTRGLMAIWGNAPESQTLAQAIHDRTLYWTATRQGFDHLSAGQGVYRDTAIRGHTLAITNRSLVPATIVEVAFVTNAQDAALLKDASFLRAAARGIADGAGAFLLARLPDGPIVPGRQPADGGSGSPSTPGGDPSAPGDGGTQPPSDGTGESPAPGTGDGTSPAPGSPGDGTGSTPGTPGGTPGSGDPGGAPAPAPNPPAPQAPPVAGPPFLDVSGTLAGEVEQARQLGLVKGYDGNLFRPKDPVSRAEFAAMVVRAVEAAGGRQLPLPESKSFPDVSPRQALYEYVLKAAGQGYIRGTPAGTFEPDRPIRREEAAAILRRAGELPPATTRFRDVPQGSGFTEAIAAAAAAQILQGYSDERFGYGEPIDRAQAAAAVVRLYEYLR
ncbi:N-acetylmuramoyl-L-alanine amidase [Thermaerobacter sp. PB12/4term]|uniref:N-acetylmuramoyl-L-alanine amidase n=1 Tax=Thermaerobacter sp. PB12/4term TaxID=2293838 RepID=UPI001FAC4CFD|nr:N-acetylmuramoyl-L-alanine amidase [Thermaerobacter sp. PB12/4term]